MATVNKQLVSSQKAAAADTPQVFYTSPSNALGTIITNFTASNDTSATRTYKAYIVASGGSATVPLVPKRAIVTDRTDISPEMAGSTLLTSLSALVKILLLLIFLLVRTKMLVMLILPRLRFMKQTPLIHWYHHHVL